MRLRQYAERIGITYQAAFNQFKAGKIKGAYKLGTGTIVIPNDFFDELEDTALKEDHIVIYARVSSAENRPNLNSQVNRLRDFAAAKGWVVNEIIKECASGLNDNRPKLNKILSDRKATKIIVEHKDRLTRFGFNFIQTLYPECEIIVVNEVDEKEDLFQDFISLVTSFSARIYGQRRGRRKTEKIIEELNKEE